MGFRVLKWAIAIGLVVYSGRAPYVWWRVAGALALGVIVHLVWRTKTKGWAQPWGGWDDLDATRDISRMSVLGSRARAHRNVTDRIDDTRGFIAALLAVRVSRYRRASR